MMHGRYKSDHDKYGRLRQWHGQQHYRNINPPLVSELQLGRLALVPTTVRILCRIVHYNTIRATLQAIIFVRS